MSGKPRKHHNLRHVLPAAEQAAALLKVGGAGATATSAGELILAAKQKELQGLFEKVYNAPTSSFNNDWLRRKLLAAVGLPPHWRPAPLLAPELPAAHPEECSRYGRRRRRVATFTYGAPESSSEEDEGEREESPAPRAIRRRTSHASLMSGASDGDSLSRREGSADTAVVLQAFQQSGPASGSSSAANSSAAGSVAGSVASTPSAILALQAAAWAVFAQPQQQAPQQQPQLANPVAKPFHTMQRAPSAAAPLAALPAVPPVARAASAPLPAPPALASVPLPSQPCQFLPAPPALAPVPLPSQPFQFLPAPPALTPVPLPSQPCQFLPAPPLLVPVPLPSQPCQPLAAALAEPLPELPGLDLGDLQGHSLDLDDLAAGLESTSGELCTLYSWDRASAQFLL